MLSLNGFSVNGCQPLNAWDFWRLLQSSSHITQTLMRHCSSLAQWLEIKCHLNFGYVRQKKLWKYPKKFKEIVCLLQSSLVCLCMWWWRPNAVFLVLYADSVTVWVMPSPDLLTYAITNVKPMRTQLRENVDVVHLKGSFTPKTPLCHSMMTEKQWWKTLATIVWPQKSP